LRVLKKNILFDFDDAIYVNEQCDNIAAKKLARLRYTLRFANWTIVENQTNVQFAKSCGSKNTLLITGPIECRRYMPFERETCSEDIIIGWIGGPSTTKYLDIVRKPLQQIVEKYPHVKLLLIGANDLSIEGVNVETHPWALDTEVELLKRFDIGIMPLYDDIWCAGKGGYKLLQYMAMGIPSVVSPVGINTDIVNSSKFGLLAATESDWLICFEKLIIDAALRAEMGRDARINALHLFSYQKYAKDLAACFI
jgi:glycosyltransferase involved in cell wall biosynthesis